MSEPIHIISDGTTMGTKVLDSSGNIISYIKRIELVCDVDNPLVETKIEFIKQTFDVYTTKEEKPVKRNKIVAFLENLLK